MHREVQELLMRYAMFPELMRTRVRIFYGNLETGEVAPQDTEVLGYVRIYMAKFGAPPVLMLLNNANAKNGSQIRGNILRVCATGRNVRELYRHPKYVAPEVSVEWVNPTCMWAVRYNGHRIKLFGATEGAKADRYADFLAGRRDNK